MNFRFRFCLLYGLIAHHVNSIVFSKFPICKKKEYSENTFECSNSITANFALSNNQAIAIAGYAIRTDDSVVHYTFQAKKSAVRVSYDLVYEMNVFSDFSEDIYEYTYSEVGKNPLHFCYVKDMDKCRSTNNGVPLSPDGLPLAWSSGKCCWCGDATFVASNKELGRRSNLKCGGFDTFLGRSVWLTKSCPRVYGPWYSAFTFGNWRWDYSIEIFVERYVPSPIDDPDVDGLFSNNARDSEFQCIQELEKKKRGSNEHVSASSLNATSRNFTSNERYTCQYQRARAMGSESNQYVLNITNPGINDEKFGINLMLTGSQPQTDSFPPSLKDKVLFIPDHYNYTLLSRNTSLYENCILHGINLKERDQCYFDALFIPKTMTDFSGQQCNVIGTSLRTWGDMNGQFCSVQSGSCMSNQAGALRREDENRLRRNEAVKFHLTDKSIPGGFMSNPSFHLIHSDNKKQLHKMTWNYNKEHLTGLELELNSIEYISWLQNVANGRIYNIRTEQDCSGFNEQGCTIEIDTINIGTEKGRFSISIPYCVDAVSEKIVDEVKPVGLSSLTIESNAVKAIQINMQAFIMKPASYMCKVVLYDEHYRRLDVSVFNISFKKHEPLYQGMHQDSTPPEVNVTEVKTPKSNSYFLSIHGLFDKIKSSQYRLNDIKQCNCTTLICYTINIFPCLFQLRHAVVTIGASLAIAFTIYTCSPAAILLTKLLFRLLYYIRTQHARCMTQLYHKLTSYKRKKKCRSN